MIVNPIIIAPILITKMNLQDHPTTFLIHDIIKPRYSVELVEVTIDEKLTFEKHKNKLC